MPAHSFARRTDAGLTVLELLVVVAIAGVLLAIGIVGFVHAQRSAHEAAAIGNLKTVATAEMTLYARKVRFGVIGELFEDGLLTEHQFRRGSSGGSESIADGVYEFSVRFGRDAFGITIDADPTRPNRATHRRFRYRLGRRTATGVSGSEGLMLAAQPSVASPPPRAYKPLQ